MITSQQGFFPIPFLSHSGVYISDQRLLFYPFDLPTSQLRGPCVPCLMFTSQRARALSFPCRHPSHRPQSTPLHQTSLSLRSHLRGDLSSTPSNLTRLSGGLGLELELGLDIPSRRSYPRPGLVLGRRSSISTPAYGSAECLRYRCRCRCRC